MKNQFFYKVKQPVESPTINGEAQEQQYKDILCSCNLDKVLISIETSTGRTLVMDHMHEKEYGVPVYNKNRVKTGEKMMRGMFQTEILLDHVESAEYVKLTSANE